jgi:hypothetical protein
LHSGQIRISLSRIEEDDENHDVELLKRPPSLATFQMYMQPPASKAKATSCFIVLDHRGGMLDVFRAWPSTRSLSLFDKDEDGKTEDFLRIP